MIVIAERRDLMTPGGIAGSALLQEEIAAMSILPPLEFVNDWQKGQCRHGSDCRFAHHEEKPSSPRDNDGPIYRYCREWLNVGKCTRPKCTYKHEKPPPDLAPLPRKPSAPATEQGGDSSNPYPDGRIDSPAPGVDEGF